VVRQRRPAYTLFELILVLAILIILSAIAFPSLDSMYAGYRLSAAADQVRAAWVSGRAQAVDEGRPYRFAVVLGKGNYRLAPGSREYWGGGQPPAGDARSNPPLVLDEALPRTVRFATPESLGYAGGDGGEIPPGSVPPSAWVPLVTFLPDGTARENVEVL